MPFENLITDQKRREIVRSAIEQISPLINKSLHIDIAIAFIEWDQIKEYYTEVLQISLINRALTDGPGVTIGNTLHQSQLKHFVILNMFKIETLGLSVNEIHAVIAHELGHIFNEPVPFEDQKDFIYSQFLRNLITQDEFKKEIEINNQNRNDYQKNKEFFADYYATTLNFKEGLMQGIKKVIAQKNVTNRELFIERLQNLENGVVFLGSVKKIRTA